jgi:calcium/calmodulin-dependent protein kinase (CaM kinase) II
MASPKVRLMGDVAVVTYVRLVQTLGESGAPVTAHFEETRVWQMQQGKWQHVHFHRSPCH